MKKIKIVHLISSLKRGGAETFLCDLLTSMSSNQFEHHVIYFHQGMYQEVLYDAGITTHHIAGVVSMYDPVFCVGLLRTIQSIKPDMIHTLLWSAHILGSICGRWLCIPVVSALHSHAEVTGCADTTRCKRIKRALTRAAFKRVQRILTVSDAIAHEFQQTYPAYDTARLTVIKNGINGQEVSKRMQEQRVTREHLNLAHDQFVIGMVGRFIPLKNHRLLLEVFAHLHSTYPQARLLLVGYGPIEQELRQYAGELGIAHATIFVVNKPAYGYYHMFDCFVLPSKTEGISIALLEAMIAQRATITSSPNGTHEVIVNRGNGLVVGATHQALYDALKTLICDAELRSALGKQAFITASFEHDIQTVVKKYQMIFENVYGKGNNSIKSKKI